MGSKMDYVVACDPQRSTMSNYMGKYHIRGIPHAFIIGRDGKIVWHGHPMEPDFEQNLQQVANSPSQPKVDFSKLSESELLSHSVKELKEWLRFKGIDFSGAVEKQDLVKLITK